MNHEIRIYGNPVLRAQADSIDQVTDEIRALGQEMIEIMHESEGVGLAAQQIGETIAICVVDVPEEYDTDEDGERLNPGLSMPLILINPVVSKPSKKEISHEEGCLSFPGIRGNINRPAHIHLSCLNGKGEQVDADVNGFVARVIQHEIDHLNGILFIDRMSAAKRMMLKSKLKRLREND